MFSFSFLNKCSRKEGLELIPVQKTKSDLRESADWTSSDRNFSDELQPDSPESEQRRFESESAEQLESGEWTGTGATFADEHLPNSTERFRKKSAIPEQFEYSSRGTDDPTSPSSRDVLSELIIGVLFVLLVVCFGITRALLLHLLWIVNFLQILSYLQQTHQMCFSRESHCRAFNVLLLLFHLSVTLFKPAIAQQNSRNRLL